MAMYCYYTEIQEYGYHNTWPCMVITIQELGTILKNQALEEMNVPKNLRGGMSHSTVFCFRTGVRDNMLLLTPPGDKVPAN